MSQGIAQEIIACFRKGKKLLICGNGGSAAMAQHMAAEFICKFEHDRKPLPAIALTTDTSILTAVSNDYDFSQVFARQIQALGKRGDILLVLSTSGKSPNCLAAIEACRGRGIKVIEFPRKGRSTARIQEYQFTLMHDVCRLVEHAFV